MIKWWQARRAGLALTLAAVMGGGLVCAGSAAAAQPSPPSDARLAAGPAITLITGDRVLVTGGAGPHEVSVRPGSGREGISFLRYVQYGDTFVVPADAATLVSAGVLDRRLFNVTKLVEFGYHDGARADLPLIVGRGVGMQRMTSAGATVTRELPSIDAAAVRQDKRTAGEFWQRLGVANERSIAGAERILLDGPVRATLAESVPQIGAPVAWQAGHTGAGVTVAVLDTGLDAEHPDLAGALVEARDFTGSPSGTDDRVFHGTHVASTIAGDGAASDGRYTGVAPDANLIVGKVLDDIGFGTESTVVAGMEWAAPRARVVNMSLGADWDSDGSDVMSQAVNRLTAQTGTLFVVSAGNSGPGEETLGVPAAADAALTVGAVDKQNALAPFSSRGPRFGDQAIKPDVTAPGVDIVAARARNAQVGEPGQRYMSASGTSMAAPHVAGAAAILAGQRPGWRAEQLKAALIGSATPSHGPTVYEQGAGRVDVARAATQAVYATPASVSNGIVQWPHDDDTPIHKPVTYHNDGPQPLTLNLALDVRDGAGNPAPAGMFTLDAQQVTVPAGGTASVTLTTDTRVEAPDGRYGGVLVATGDGATVRTPVGVVRDIESYDVRISFRDRQGAPTSAYAYALFGIDEPKTYDPYNPSGTVTVRVPKGRYFAVAAVIEPDDSGPTEVHLSQFVEPEIHVTAPTTLVFDSRDARPVVLQAAARPEATPIRTDGLIERQTSHGPIRGTFTFSARSTLRPSLTSATEPGQFTITFQGEVARPDGTGWWADSPYAYHLGWTADGRVPAELTRTFADRELVVVPARYAAAPTGDQFGWIVDKVRLSLPATVTHYYAPNLRWYDVLFVGGAAYEDPVSVTQFSRPRSYSRESRHEQQRWGYAAFGPAFPAGPRHWVTREGDTLSVELNTFSDHNADHFGRAAVDSAIIELYRDGVELAESPFEGYLHTTVPADAGTYRLHAESVRASVSELSTRISADWTFRSAHTSEQRPVPLMALRFAPLLDDHNRAPAGRPFVVPVYVQRQPDASYGRLTELTVRVSFDDGATWRPVPLLGRGLERVALVHHPRREGFVSLQATAADSGGNRVEQTIIRAYKLRAP